MKNFIELSKEESILIEGGDAYEAGVAVGKYLRDCYDFYRGIFDGLTK
jgi:hypothetical protein